MKGRRRARRFIVTAAHAIVAPPFFGRLREMAYHGVMTADALAAEYRLVRAETVALCAGLEVEDFVVQPIDDVSPPKWHLGHTTWFFETFLLAPSGRSPRADFAAVFNSYYRSVGDPYPRSRRGTRSRPTVRQVASYREEIDEEACRLLLGAGEAELRRLEPVLRLGLQHEQQHQELLAADIKFILAHNGVAPRGGDRPASAAAPERRVEFAGGLFRMGYRGDGFSFDNERPDHDVAVAPFRIASRLVTRGEYAEFIRDGGYRDFRHWLSDGWDRVSAERWQAPLHWELGGEDAAVASHLSYFEADAFARWAGARLPTEAEWELAASAGAGLEQLFGAAWQWTSSAYGPYPGFRPLAGAFGEYNGKFMSGQFVLRGGSFATPAGHERITYRNFFQPEKRWQFTGVRLAWDA